MSDHDLSACVMVPHIVPVDENGELEAIDAGYNALKHERGFHKRIDHVTCSCGERFERESGNGMDALAAAQQHVQEAE